MTMHKRFIATWSICIDYRSSYRIKLYKFEFKLYVQRQPVSHSW